MGDDGRCPILTTNEIILRMFSLLFLRVSKGRPGYSGSTVNNVPITGFSHLMFPTFFRKCFQNNDLPLSLSVRVGIWSNQSLKNMEATIG